MKATDIKEGETYHFVATMSKYREHLVGKPFTVATKKKVWRAQTTSRRHKVWRVFNQDGIAARPDELEPLPENNCSDCQVGEMVQEGMTQPSGRQDYKCNNCGRVESFP